MELEKLRRRTKQLEAELDRTKLALEITGKAHALCSGARLALPLGANPFRAPASRALRLW